MHNVLTAQINAAIGMPGGSELLLILLIVLVVFGHNRIPQLGEALGKGIRNFRKSFAKDEEETAAGTETVEQLPNPEPAVEEKLAQAETETTPKH